MQGPGPSCFDGLTESDLRELLSRIERRTYPAGSVMIAQGDKPGSLFIIESGTASILVAESGANEYLIGEVGPGTTLGEMSMLTGQPAAATVRAATEATTLVMTHAAFHRFADRFPVLYRNLGAILADRLAQGNERVLPRHGKVTIMLDHGAPPLLGYALACSLAWHTRGSVLLVYLSEDSPPAELLALAKSEDMLSARFSLELRSVLADARMPQARAYLVLSTPKGPLIGHELPEKIEHLARIYDHVLLQIQGPEPPRRLQGRYLHLVGDAKPVPGPTGRVVRAWADGSQAVRPLSDGSLPVAEFVPIEAESLSRGLLQPRSFGSKALGWLARDLAGLKVGFALGSGSVWGYAYIGVVDKLTRMGLEADFVAGSSIGSALGALHSLGCSPVDMAQLMDSVGRHAFRPTLPRISLLSSRAIQRGVKAYLHETLIEEMPIPYAVVAADLLTGREVVFTCGRLWPALMASMAIPGVYPPRRIGDNMLIDGGVLSPVPTRAVTNLGADVVVAVKAASQPQLEAGRGGGPPWVLYTIQRAFEIMEGKIGSEDGASATVRIEPDFTHAPRYGLRNFSKGRSYIELGEAAAEAAMPRLQSALPWLRPAHQPDAVEPSVPVVVSQAAPSEIAEQVRT